MFENIFFMRLKTYFFVIISFLFNNPTAFCQGLLKAIYSDTTNTIEVKWSSEFGSFCGTGTFDTTTSNNITDTVTFFIERSKNGYKFKTIGRNDTIDDPFSIKFYSFIDNDIDDALWMNGYYYRIKKMNSGLNYEYSSVVLVKYNYDGKIKLQAYPNPTKDKINIDLHIFPKENCTVTFTDLFGKEVARMNQLTSSSTILNMENLHSGVYLVHLLKDNRIVAYQKLILE